MRLYEYYVLVVYNCSTQSAAILQTDWEGVRYHWDQITPFPLYIVPVVGFRETIEAVQ